MGVKPSKPLITSATWCCMVMQLTLKEYSQVGSDKVAIQRDASTMLTVAAAAFLY